MDEEKKPTILGAFKVLVIIPITLIIDAVLIRIGYTLDSAMYEPSPDTPGFMFPAITILALLIAAVISLIMFIVMIVLLIIRINRAVKAAENNEETEEYRE